jgi:hypothetical protein
VGGKGVATAAGVAGTLGLAALALNALSLERRTGVPAPGVLGWLLLPERSEKAETAEITDEFRRRRLPIRLRKDLVGVGEGRWGGDGEEGAETEVVVAMLSLSDVYREIGRDGRGWLDENDDRRGRGGEGAKIDWQRIDKSFDFGPGVGVGVGIEVEDAGGGWCSR